MVPKNHFIFIYVLILQQLFSLAKELFLFDRTRCFFTTPFSVCSEVNTSIIAKILNWQRIILLYNLIDAANEMIIHPVPLVFCQACLYFFPYLCVLHFDASAFDHRIFSWSGSIAVIHPKTSITTKQLVKDFLIESPNLQVYLSPELTDSYRISVTTSVSIRASINRTAANSTVLLIDYGPDIRLTLGTLVLKQKNDVLCNY